jgi:hypothetical protein
MYPKNITSNVTLLTSILSWLNNLGEIFFHFILEIIGQTPQKVWTCSSLNLCENLVSPTPSPNLQYNINFLHFSCKGWLDLQSLFWLLCTAVLIGWDPATPLLPPHLGSYTRALLDSQDRRHLFVIPWIIDWEGQIKMECGPICRHNAILKPQSIK